MVATKYLQEKRKGCMEFLSVHSLKFFLSWEVAALSTRTRSTSGSTARRTAGNMAPLGIPLTHEGNPAYQLWEPTLDSLCPGEAQLAQKTSKEGLAFLAWNSNSAFCVRRRYMWSRGYWMDRGGEGMTFDFWLLEAPGVYQSILQLVPVSHDREFWTYNKTFLFWSQGVLFFFFKALVDSECFPGSSEYVCNAADLGSMPGLARSPGGGNNLLL